MIIIKATDYGFRKVVQVVMNPDDHSGYMRMGLLQVAIQGTPRRAILPAMTAA